MTPWAYPFVVPLLPLYTELIPDFTHLFGRSPIWIVEPPIPIVTVPGGRTDTFPME